MYILYVNGLVHRKCFLEITIFSRFSAEPDQVFRLPTSLGGKYSLLDVSLQRNTSTLF